MALCSFIITNKAIMLVLVMVYYCRIILHNEIGTATFIAVVHYCFCCNDPHMKLCKEFILFHFPPMKVFSNKSNVLKKKPTNLSLNKEINVELLIFYYDPSIFRKLNFKYKWQSLTLYMKRPGVTCVLVSIYGCQSQYYFGYSKN